MRKKQEEDDKMTGGLGSGTLAPPLKINVHEIKMQEGRRFNDMINDKVTGHFGGLVRKFEMMTTGENLKRMTEIRMAEIIENS